MIREDSRLADRSSKLFLGADGGQTHSLAVLVDEHGQLISIGHSGPCNHFDPVSKEQCFSNAVREITSRAFQDAGRLLDSGLTASCFGLSDNWEQAGDTIRACIPGGKLRIVEDVIAAHSGALAMGPGIVILAGTGSVAYGVSTSRITARAGGWGPILGDEGAGYVIGLHVLRAAAKAQDGRGESTALLELTLSHFGQTDLKALNDDLLSGVISRVQIASLTKVAAQAGRDGDAVALQIFNRAGEELAHCVYAVAQKLEWEAPPVSAVGGVFRAGSVILNPFWDYLSQWLPRADYQPARYPPVLGAALIAIRDSLGQISPIVLDNLDRGLIDHQTKLEL